MSIFYAYVFSYLISVACRLYKVSTTRAGKFFWLTLVTPVLGQYLLNKWKNRNSCLYIWTKDFSACILNLNCLLFKSWTACWTVLLVCISLIFSLLLFTYLSFFNYLFLLFLLWCNFYTSNNSVKSLFKSCLLLDVLI